MKKKTFLIIILVVSAILGATMDGLAAEEKTVCAKDSFFPEEGNCGYDVLSYDINLVWDQAPDRINSDVKIALETLWDMDSLSLDFKDVLQTAWVSVDGIPASFTHENNNLTITHNFSHDTKYEIEIVYSGMPQSYNIFSEVDARTYDNEGAPFTIMGEPTEASSWFPCNDTPKDKALFTSMITVPAKYFPASNGRLKKVIYPDGTEQVPAADFTYSNDPEAKGLITAVYEAEEPMASYLFTISIDTFDVSQKTLRDDLVQLDFVSQDLEEKEAAKENTELTDEILACFEPVFGTYPFKDIGSAVFNKSMGGALETQTRSVFDIYSIADEVFAHELSHQWMGDLVSLSDWSDLWIKEGFATYSEALWKRCSEGEEAYAKTMKEFYYATIHGNSFVVAGSDYADTYKSHFDLSAPLKKSLSECASMIERITQVPLTEEQQGKLNEVVSSASFSGNDFWNFVSSNCEKVIISNQIIRELREFFGLSTDEVPTDAGTSPKNIEPAINGLYSVWTYQAGSLVYYVLNHELGDEVFSKGLKLIFEQYKNGNINEETFIAAFNEAAGRDLSDLIKSWLYYDKVPDLPGIATYDEIYSMLYSDIE